MRVAAVVPVKALGAAKSRLSRVLAPEDRAALTLWLLGRVLTAIRASGMVDKVAVVSPEEASLKRARAVGAHALRQVEGDLDAALEQGREWAASTGAEALLVVLGDLPLLSAGDVRSLIERAARMSEPPTTSRGGGGVVVLAPDRAETGTNALVLRPLMSMPLAFGRDSYARHLALAAEHDIKTATYRSPGTAFDVDGPADLDELRATGMWWRAEAWRGASAAKERADGHTT